MRVNETEPNAEERRADLEAGFTSVMGQDAFGSLELKAAVHLESVARNHPLVDGNKRTSWTLMVLFLWRTATGTTSPRTLLSIWSSEGRLSLEESSDRIGARLVPREG